jgi:hypothetical protein
MSIAALAAAEALAPAVAEAWPTPPSPTACKSGGYTLYATAKDVQFTNQGDCVSYANIFSKTQLP